MSYICDNCGGRLHKKGNLYVCDICQKEFCVEDLEKEAQETSEFIDNFKARNEKLFSIELSSDKSIAELKDMIVSLQNSVSDISESSEKMRQETIDEIKAIMSEKGPLNQDYKVDEKSTYDALLDIAESTGNYGVVAFQIRHDVENALINKFKLEHLKSDFVMSKDEFEKKWRNYRPDPVKRPYFTPFKLFTLKSPQNHDDMYAINPTLRFLKCGFDYDNAGKCTKLWTNCNNFIHSSPENIAAVERLKKECDLKEYFTDMINYFKERGLLRDK